MNSRDKLHAGYWGTKAWSWLFIALVVLVLGGWYYRFNSLPAGHDAQGHLWQAIRLADYLRGATDGAFSPWGGSVKYSLLTSLLTALLFLLTDYAFWSCLIVTLLFCLLALAALAALGRQLAPRRFASMLPLMAMPAAPCFWEIGLSYNLESGLLAAVVVASWLFWRAERWRKPWATVLAAAAVALATQSKLVFLLFVLPAAVPWCLTGSLLTQRRRRIFSAAMVAAVIVWLAPHLGSVRTEVLLDYRNPTGEVFPGPLFYGGQLLFGYRGLPLVLGLAGLIVWRVRRGQWRREDAGFLCWVLVPLLFFSAMETKRAWYLLPAYPALSAWFLFNVESAPGQRWSRILAFGLTVFYTVLAFYNLVSLALQLAAPTAPQVVAGIRPPEPPRVAERELAGLALSAHFGNPLQHIVVDVAAAEMMAPRLETLFWQAEPALAGNHRLEAFGSSSTDLPRLVQTAADAYQIFAVNKDSLRLDCGETPTAECASLADTYARLAERFAISSTSNLPNGETLNIFTRR